MDQLFTIFLQITSIQFHQAV